MIGALLLAVLEHLVLRLLLPLQVFLRGLLLFLFGLALSAALRIDGMVRPRNRRSAVQTAECETKDGSNSLHESPRTALIS